MVTLATASVATGSLPATTMLCWMLRPSCGPSPSVPQNPSMIV